MMPKDLRFYGGQLSKLLLILLPSVISTDDTKSRVCCQRDEPDA